MMRVLLAQCVLTVVVSVIFWTAWGLDFGLSAFIGAMSYFVPNLLLAAQIKVIERRVGSTGGLASVVLFGELLKILVTIVFMLIAVKFFEGLSWPAFLFGLLLVLNSYFVLLLPRKKKRSH